MEIGEFGVGGGVHIQQVEHRPVFFSQRVDVLVGDFAFPDRFVVFDDGPDFDRDGGVGGLDVLIQISNRPSRPDDKLQTAIFIGCQECSGGNVIIDSGLHNDRGVRRFNGDEIVFDEHIWVSACNRTANSDNAD